MADKNLLQLPLATTSTGALLYGIQDNQDKAFTPSVLMGGQSAQAANFVYAGPVAPPGALPSFRKLVPNDIPDLSAFYMKTTGGALVSPVITNPTITGGSISGTNIIADDDKWRMRNATDTTKQIRFDVSAVTPGTTRTFNWPNASGEVAVTNAAQDLTNKLVYLRPSANTGSSFRIPHGQPPVAPQDGDIWTTAGGMYAQISGVTVGPLAAEQTSYVTSFNTRVGAITLLPADITNALGYTPWNTNTNLSTSASITAGSISDSSGNLRTGTGGLDSKFNISGGVINGPTRITGEFRVGDGANGEIRMVTGSSGTVYWDSRATVAGTTPNGTAYYRADNHNWTRSDGTVVAALSGSGSLKTLGGMQTFSGTFATQAGVLGRGWNNSVVRWLDVLESDGSLSVYAYNGSGGGGVQLVNYKTTSTGGSNLTAFTGAVTASGGFGPGSDPRLKDSSSFRPVNSALSQIAGLNVTYGKYHDWYNPDGKERVFLMADEAMSIHAPHALVEDLVIKDGEKYDGWSADQMIALLTKAVQELTEKVKTLEEKLNA